jgi:ferric-dicitrate binding protein FerR (iron transport regulator)
VNSIGENIQQIIVAFLTNDISKEDLLALNNWRNESFENNEDFEQIKLLWEKTAHLHLFNEVDVNSDWKKVKAQLSAKEQTESKIVSDDAPSLAFIWRRVAAVLIPVILLSSALYLYLNVAGFGRLTAYKTNGTIMEVKLPDHSTVILNKNSEIVYPKNMAQQSNRRVTVSGEAFFNVTHNNTPFIVDAGDAQVKVLGTEFNVKQLQDNLYVSVVKGKVSVETSSQKVELVKGERAIYKEGVLVEEDLNSFNNLYWKSHKLTFTQASIKEICAELKNTFPEIKELKYTGKDEDIKVTTSFENQSLSEIIEELSIHFDKKIQFDGSILTISD